jgi:hypothetical protein
MLTEENTSDKVGILWGAEGINTKGQYILSKPLTTAPYCSDKGAKTEAALVVVAMPGQEYLADTRVSPWAPGWYHMNPVTPCVGCPQVKVFYECFNDSKGVTTIVKAVEGIVLGDVKSWVVTNDSSQDMFVSPGDVKNAVHYLPPGATFQYTPGADNPILSWDYVKVTVVLGAGHSTGDAVETFTAYAFADFPTGVGVTQARDPTGSLTCFTTRSEDRVETSAMFAYPIPEFTTWWFENLTPDPITVLADDNAFATLFGRPTTASDTIGKPIGLQPGYRVAVRGLLTTGATATITLPDATSVTLPLKSSATGLPSMAGKYEVVTGFRMEGPIAGDFDTVITSSRVPGVSRIPSSGAAAGPGFVPITSDTPDLAPGSPLIPVAPPAPPPFVPGGNPSSGEPSANRPSAGEPSGGEGPSADKGPSADDDPSAGEPSAAEDPSGGEPSAAEDPSGGRPITDDPAGFPGEAPQPSGGGLSTTIIVVIAIAGLVFVGIVIGLAVWLSRRQAEAEAGPDGGAGDADAK